MQLGTRASRFLIGLVTCFATHYGIPAATRAQRQRVQSLNGDSPPQMRGFPLVGPAEDVLPEEAGFVDEAPFLAVITLVAFVAALLAAAPARAVSDRWSRHGPEGVDGARTWRAVNGGLTASRMSWVVADPSRPNVVYAGTTVGGGIQAVQKSEDGGNTWSDPGQLATALGIDPSNPDVLYAGGLGKIYRSDDGGRHWSFLRKLPTESPNPQIRSLIVSTKDPDTIYAGFYGDGLFRSTDGGLHWARRPIGLRDEPIVAMAMNPTHPRALYVALAGRGIYKTGDGGRTWREVLADPGAVSIAVDPSNPDRVYAGYHRARVYATDDGGRSWNQAVDGLARHGDITSIAVDPLRHATLYAGVSGRGVFESTDFGDRWHRFSAGLDDPRVTGLVFASDGATLHAATDGGGVFER